MHESDLRGIDSHGVGMFPTYDERRLAGKLNMQPNITVQQDDAATALIDADNAMGHVPATQAAQLACDKAQEFGVGVVTVGAPVITAQQVYTRRWHLTRAHRYVDDRNIAARCRAYFRA